MNEKNQQNYSLTRGLFRDESKDDKPRRPVLHVDFKSELLRKLERTQEEFFNETGEFTDFVNDQGLVQNVLDGLVRDSNARSEHSIKNVRDNINNISATLK